MKFFYSLKVVTHRVNSLKVYKKFNTESLILRLLVINIVFRTHFIGRTTTTHDVNT